MFSLVLLLVPPQIIRDSQSESKAEPKERLVIRTQVIPLAGIKR
jgi:hypothetical protein